MSAPCKDCDHAADNQMAYPTGYEDCIVGCAERFGGEGFLVIDKSKLLAKLMLDDGMTANEAEEFFEFNILGAWMGERTPAFITMAESEQCV